MDTTLADIGRNPNTWTPAQRTALRAAFTALRDFFKEALILRGKRATVEGYADGSGLHLTVECDFKPNTIIVSSVFSSATGLYAANYPLVWSWDGETVTFTDPIVGLLTSGTFTVDVFIERA